MVLSLLGWLINKPISSRDMIIVVLSTSKNKLVTVSFDFKPRDTLNEITFGKVNSMNFASRHHGKFLKTLKFLKYFQM